MGGRGKRAEKEQMGENVGEIGGMDEGGVREGGGWLSSSAFYGYQCFDTGHRISQQTLPPRGHKICMSIIFINIFRLRAFWCQQPARKDFIALQIPSLAVEGLAVLPFGWLKKAKDCNSYFSVQENFLKILSSQWAAKQKSVINLCTQKEFG